MLALEADVSARALVRFRDKFLTQAAPLFLPIQFHFQNPKVRGSPFCRAGHKPVRIFARHTNKERSP